MTIPVWVEQQNGTFTASVPGVPQLRADGISALSAVSALQTIVRDRREHGELVLMDLPEPQPRQFSEDELAEMREMVDEAYRYRDELKRQEFPE